MFTAAPMVRPAGGVEAQLVRAVQLLDIHQVSVVPEAVAHAHEDIRAAQQRARFAGMLGQKPAGFHPGWQAGYSQIQGVQGGHR